MLENGVTTESEFALPVDWHTLYNCDSWTQGAKVACGIAFEATGSETEPEEPYVVNKLTSASHSHDFIQKVFKYSNW